MKKRSLVVGSSTVARRCCWINLCCVCRTVKQKLKYPDDAWGIPFYTYLTLTATGELHMKALLRLKAEATKEERKHAVEINVIKRANWGRDWFETMQAEQIINKVSGFRHLALGICWFEAVLSGSLYDPQITLLGSCYFFPHCCLSVCNQLKTDVACTVAFLEEIFADLLT